MNKELNGALAVETQHSPIAIAAMSETKSDCLAFGTVNTVEFTDGGFTIETWLPPSRGDGKWRHFGVERKPTGVLKHYVDGSSVYPFYSYISTALELFNKTMNENSHVASVLSASTFADAVAKLAKLDNTEARSVAEALLARIHMTHDECVERFEAWARPNGYDLRRNKILGHYANVDTTRAFEGFMAFAGKPLNFSKYRGNE